jgi:hypothetical protein
LFIFAFLIAPTLPCQAEDARVIFYLHGKIIEDQGVDAESERFGRYEYEAILNALGRDGHRIISEVRKPNTNPWEYARQVVAEIERLEKAGLPPDKITVVGASKGAAITVLVSHLLKDQDINYVLLAICGPRMLEFYEENGICVTGRILSIFDTSDDLAGSCGALAQRCSAGIGLYKEIELGLGNGHGMVYRPYEEWVAPVLQWSMTIDSRDLGSGKRSERL